MKNKIFIPFFITLISISALYGGNSDSFLKKRSEEKRVVINNRILARPNGKPISTYDLMKKMDLAFYRQFPEYSSSTDARFQYYQFGWRAALSDMVDKELILADAQESKIVVSGGDVRQEIELSFGPNIIANLDKAGFSYDEAFKLMQEEILIRQLVAGRAHAKAVRQVTPNKIRQAYDEFIQDPANARLTQWSYRMITVKERNLEKTEETAKIAYNLLMEGVPPDQIASTLKEKNILGRKGSVTISNVIKQNDKEISTEYRTQIANLDKGMYTQPFRNKSRSTNSVVYRILTIEDKVPGGVPSYREMEGKLKEELLDKEMDKETDQYLLKLRQHYHVRESDIDNALPPNYEPFVLK